MTGVDAPDATNANHHDLQVTPAYVESLPPEVRDHLACRIVDQPAGSVALIDRLRAEGRLADVVELGATLLGKAAYHARNRWMVDRAALVIGFPRGAESAGGGT